MRGLGWPPWRSVLHCRSAVGEQCPRLEYLATRCRQPRSPCRSVPRSRPLHLARRPAAPLGPSTAMQAMHLAISACAGPAAAPRRPTAGVPPAAAAAAAAPAAPAVWTPRRRLAPLHASSSAARQQQQQQGRLRLRPLGSAAGDEPPPLALSSGALAGRRWSLLGCSRPLLPTTASDLTAACLSLIDSQAMRRWPAAPAAAAPATTPRAAAAATRRRPAPAATATAA